MISDNAFMIVKTILDYINIFLASQKEWISYLSDGKKESIIYS